MNSEFKIGDKVRCIDDVNSSFVVKNTIYTVSSYDKNGHISLYEDFYKLWWNVERFVLVQDQNQDISDLTGVKHDKNKPDLSILSYDALCEISRAFEFGAVKYGRYNYLGGMQWTRLASAAARHLFKWVWGEDKDEESGLSHLAHLGACVIMLIDYSTKGLGRDDRFKGNKTKDEK